MAAPAEQEQNRTQAKGMRMSVHAQLLKYRRLTDLYTTGRVVELKDDTLVWLQVINSLERADALQDAFAAQSRLALALQEEDSDETVRMRMVFLADGREAALDRLRDTHGLDAQLEVMDELSTEEEWAERVSLLSHADEFVTVASAVEKEHLRRVMLDFTEEFDRRVQAVLAHYRATLEDLDEDGLFREYRQWWAQKRGAEVGIVEYRYTELLHSARACVGTWSEAGYDHSACEQHQLRIFESKDQVKALPEELLETLFAALAEMEVSDRDAKSQARPTGSSDSSTPPRPREDSARSIPTATSEEPLGT